MARVLGVLAALLWVVGMALLVVAFVALSPGFHADYSTHIGATADGGLFYSDDGTLIELLAGIVLVGVAGLLTAGLVLRHLRQRAG